MARPNSELTTKELVLTPRDPALPTDLPIVETFEAYYRRDYRSLVGLAYLLTGSTPAAEDLVQDTLTTTHRNWGKISHYDNPGAWVRRVMVNRSHSRFRRLRSEAAALTRFAGHRSDPIEPPESAGEVWSVVRQLPTRQRDCVALFYWEDLSIAQIAEILDCGTETVKTHLKRGRRTLANRLEFLREDQTDAR